MHILQSLFNIFLVILNLFSPIIRLLGQIITSIPGTKKVLNFIPFIGPKKEKIDLSKTFKCGTPLYTRHDMMRDYLNDPEVKERMLLETLNPQRKMMYFNNKNLKTIQHNQPPNIKMTVTFKGHHSR